MILSSALPIRLHRFRLAGHSHRVELFFSLLGLPFEIVDVLVLPDAQKAPEFLEWSRFGQVPVIEGDGYFLSDSNATLVYLAMTHDPQRLSYPSDARTVAEIQH